MKRFFHWTRWGLPLLLVGGALWAEKSFAPEAEYVAKMLAAVGGVEKLNRLETIRFSFSERVRSEEGQTGHQTGFVYIKWHDKGGFRIRVETSSSTGQTVTVLKDGGAWASEDGVLVTNPIRLQEMRREAFNKIFWFLIPHSLSDQGGTASYSGLAFWNGKMTRRLDVTLKSPWDPAYSQFSLYVDSATYLVDGAVVASPMGGENRVVSLSSYYDTPFARLAGECLLKWGATNAQSQIKVLNPVLNGVIDETLLDPPAGLSPVPAKTPVHKK